MTADKAGAQAAIAARRALTNRLIAEHQATRLRPFFTEDVCVVVGDGGLVLGVEAVIGAFESQFRDQGFVAYVRTPELVEIAEGGARAAERGRWVGIWRGGVEMSGTYLAAWRTLRGQWVIERELFVTLEG